MNHYRYTLATLIIYLASTFLLSAQVRKSPSDYWNDPEFVAAFMGSYGFLPEVEPKIQESEIELFQDLLQVIQVDPKAAATRLQQSIQPGSSAALLFVLGNLYLQTSNFDQAIAAYQQALEKFPNYRRVYKNLGIIYLQQEDFKQSIAHLTRAIELGDREGKTYGRIGFAYVQVGNFTAAEEAFRQAILQDAEELDWQQGLAQCLLENKAYGEAESLFSSLIAQQPDDPTFWRFQANVFLAQEKPAQAAINLEVVKRMGKAELQDLLLLGDIYLKQLKLFDEAIQAYALAIRTDQSAKAYKAIFNSIEIFNYFGEYEKSKSLIAMLRESFQQYLTDADDLELLNASAKIFRAEGNATEAAKILVSITERDPLNGKAILELANYFSEIGEFARAEMEFKKAQGLDAYKFDALVKHAQLLVKQKQFKKALALLEDALEIKQDDRIRRYYEQVRRAAS